jgi:hypothetical protein
LRYEFLRKTLLSPPKTRESGKIVETFLPDSR